jgi:hypothetical protein
MRTVLVLFISCFIFSISSCAPRIVRAPKTKVVYVKKRPANYTVVSVKGKRYYKWNGKNYRKTKKGYIVVR